MTRTPDLLDALGGHLDVEAPDGMILGWRSIRPDLRSRGGFRWPWPGQWAESPDDGRDLTGNHPNKACPSPTLGGLCLAKTWAGARSGSIPAHTALIVAYQPDDVLGRDDHKLRVRRCLILDVIDVCDHIQQGHAAGADLSGADLDGANLTGANLAGAFLDGANLYGANLTGANLTGANLRWATLGGANLTGANLTRAFLDGANLYGANLDGAFLNGAFLDGATLGGANLTRANLTRANLDGAFLNGAFLDGANLDGAFLDGADLAGACRHSLEPPIPGWAVVDGRLERV